MQGLKVRNAVLVQNHRLTVNDGAANPERRQLVDDDAKVAGPVESITGEQRHLRGCHKGLNPGPVVLDLMCPLFARRRCLRILGKARPDEGEWGKCGTLH
jgi:hypothetical protein